MRRTNCPVITVPATHFAHLQNICSASSGPSPCIYGLRKLYWGVDAPIIKCRNYAFKVRREIYESYKMYGR